jgi:(1->4)-alpha-D-glucan 1-alpha-D-glucosylmutase
MAKATREAKVHTSWIHINDAYERAVERFVLETLSGRTAPRFLSSFLPLQRRIAEVGMINSLAQLVLKLTSPGVPDFYQGTELWDLSLVDPDNRRAVDFDARRFLVHRLEPITARLNAGEPVERDIDHLLETWVDGAIKLFVTMRGLHVRRTYAELFSSGTYEPMTSEGPGADHVIAFARRHASGTLLTIVPRLVLSLRLDDRSLPRGRLTWGSTHIRLAERLATARYHNLLTGHVVQPTEPVLPLAEVLRTCPVAMMWSAAPDA